MPTTVDGMTFNCHEAALLKLVEANVSLQIRQAPSSMHFEVDLRFLLEPEASRLRSIAAERTLGRPCQGDDDEEFYATESRIQRRCIRAARIGDMIARRW